MSEGIEVEPPKPKKKLAHKFDVEAKREYTGPPTFNIRVCLSADVPLREAVNALEWIYPSLGV